MKIIDRYILRSFGIPLLYCLVTFTMIFVIYDLFDNMSDFMEAGTPIPRVALYYLYLLPSVMGYILPVSLMLAVLYALSVLTRHNELTAMRACGLSLFRLVTPLLLAGLLTSLAMGVINETLAPWSAYWTDRFLHLEKKSDQADAAVAYNLAYKNVPERRIWMIGAFDTRTLEMKDVTVIQQRPDGSDAYKAHAGAARWMDGRLGFFDEVERQTFDAYNNPRGKPELKLHEPVTSYTETPRDFLNEIKDPEFLSSWELYRFLENHPHLSEANVARIRVDLYSRLAMPWTCFIVVLLGVPFGTHTGRKGAFVGIVLALSLFFSYYVLSSVFMAVGKKQWMDPLLAAWLPNAIYLSFGGWLLHRMR